MDEHINIAVQCTEPRNGPAAGSGLEGADGKLTLEPAGKKLPKQLRQKFPFLDGCMLFKLPSEAQSQVRPSQNVLA